ncbi:hypothetical protein K474DRAFT_1383353 [Panus rudis PR-1116 ss-1]|nr:hypothetical protein K474DRAFT_1383353 [Panus rudis PR-1116 ss-1]
MRVSIALSAAALLSAISPAAFAIPVSADTEPIAPRDVAPADSFAPSSAVDSWQHVNFKRDPPTFEELYRRKYDAEEERRRLEREEQRRLQQLRAQQAQTHQQQLAEALRRAQAQQQGGNGGRRTGRVAPPNSPTEGGTGQNGNR